MCIFAANLTTMKRHRWLILSVFLCCSLFGNAQDWKVLFSANGGFYEDVFELELFSTYPQGRIFYTTNGGRPTVESRQYTEPLVLDESLFSKSDIYTIINTIPSLFYLPDSIQHCIVIRAAAFDENDSCISAVATNSYFIRALGCDLHGLPVLSIAADSLSLFDYETGIFIPGINYNPIDSFATGNYTMRGREWERIINMEFYEPDNSGINQECGLRAHGGASRWFQQKGMKLYAREEYGKKRFSHRFFEASDVEKYKRLCLHPFRCSNWLQTGGQEHISQTIAGNLNIESMAVRQAVVFINGEYWGLYTLEESSDERYLEDHFGIDLEKVAMLKYWGVPYHGDPTDWQNLFVWMKTADLNQPEDSAYAYAHIDVDNFVDYMLFETFSSNLDWPGNNVKIWQPEAGEPFRWIFYDGDGCFTQPEYDAIGHAVSQGLNSRIFNRFLENEWFAETFRQRYHDLCNTIFSYGYMKSVLDEFEQTVEGEIEAQSERFNFPVSKAVWHADMAKVDDFFNKRDSCFRTELDEFIVSIKELDNGGALSLCYPNPSSGEIHLLISPDAIDDQEIAIFDLLGRKVFSAPVGFSGNGEESVINPKLPKGVYVLRLGHFTQRIVML